MLRLIVGRFKAKTQCSSWRLQTDNVRVYMNSMMLFVVTLSEFQSTRKASQHLTLKNNCEAFWSHIFGWLLKFGDAREGAFGWWVLLEKKTLN